jgi:hypothetical protein
VKTRIFTVAVALAMLASAASAATVTIAYTGIITSGGVSGLSLVNQPFGLGYSFNTALATPGNYTNTGTASQVVLSNSGFSASFFTPILGGNSISGCDGFNCITNLRSSAATGSSYSQSASLTARIFFLSVTSALSSDFPFPGDITEAFALRGTGIGSGSFGMVSSAGQVNLGLRIDTVSVNGRSGTGPDPPPHCRCSRQA